LKLLDAHNARWLLIGGYAVNAFGYVRNTVDMDVWIAPDAHNQQKVLQAIRDFAFPAAPDDLLHEDDGMVRMGLPPLRIEVLKKISGVEFEDCWPRRVMIEDDDLRIPTISLDLFRLRIEVGWAPLRKQLSNFLLEAEFGSRSGSVIDVWTMCLLSQSPVPPKV
jgi:hypothetical protein